MARPLRVFTVSDFTGGLNLRADAFQLRGHESPDLLNVDLDPRGGFAQRDSVAHINSTVLSPVQGNMWLFATSTGTSQIMVQQTNDMAYSTGGNFTAINPDALTTTGKMRGATMKDLHYIQRNAEQAPCKWTGAAVSVLTQVYNDNIAAPTSGNMPLAKCIMPWKDYMWIANTVESGTAYPSRVRFSHPNQPENWHAMHYIDVGWGQDGDEIVALAPLGDRLIIFKRNSVWAISGYDVDTFSANEITHAAGAISQEAVAVTELGIYFFHWPHGVYLLRPNLNVEWLFERIAPAIEDGTIPATYQAGITLGWLRRRLWVSVPWLTSTANARVFVLDPTLGARSRGTPQGGWVQYDLALGAMVEWRRPGQATQYLAAHATLGRVLRMHQSAATDDFGSGAVAIASHYTTRWFDDEKPAVVKRWRRPEIILDDGVTCTIRLDVWRDYDPRDIKRTLYVTTDPLTGFLVWDDGSHAANMKWDDNAWATSGADAQVIKRTSLLGRGRAVQIKFTKQTTTVRWSVNAINFKYSPKRVRS